MVFSVFLSYGFLKCSMFFCLSYFPGLFHGFLRFSRVFLWFSKVLERDFIVIF